MLYLPIYLCTGLKMHFDNLDPNGQYIAIYSLLLNLFIRQRFCSCSVTGGL